MSKTATDIGKVLYNDLKSRRLLSYGSNIPAALVQSICGLQVPTTGTAKAFAALALKELTYIDYCRNKLLDNGKYLTGSPTGDYRILLASENPKQIKRYNTAATRKLRRANRLSKSSPATVQQQLTQVTAATQAKLRAARASIKKLAQLGTKKKPKATSAMPLPFTKPPSSSQPSP